MSISGLVNTFKKNDAKDVLDIEFTWNDIKDKPYGIITILEHMRDLVEYAKSVDYLTRQDTLRTVKKVINDVIMDALAGMPSGDGAEPDDGTDIHYLLTDWKDIKDKPQDIDKLSRIINNLHTVAANSTLLTRNSTPMETKDAINKVILEPLKLGDNYATATSESDSDS